LTNSQWEEISKATGLRYYVRAEINIALQKYWSERLSENETTALDVKLETVKGDLREAILGVNELAQSGAIFRGLAASHERSFAEQRLDLEMSLEWMADADRILSDAKRRLARGKGKPRKYGQLYDLIERSRYRGANGEVA
jgi:hypothetical protein